MNFFWSREKRLPVTMNIYIDQTTTIQDLKDEGKNMEYLIIRDTTNLELLAPTIIEKYSNTILGITDTITSDDIKNIIRILRGWKSVVFFKVNLTFDFCYTISKINFDSVSFYHCLNLDYKSAYCFSYTKWKKVYFDHTIIDIKAFKMLKDTKWETINLTCCNKKLDISHCFWLKDTVWKNVTLRNLQLENSDCKALMDTKWETVDLSLNYIGSKGFKMLKNTPWKKVDLTDNYVDFESCIYLKDTKWETVNLSYNKKFDSKCLVVLKDTVWKNVDLSDNVFDRHFIEYLQDVNWFSMTLKNVKLTEEQKQEIESLKIPKVITDYWEINDYFTQKHDVILSEILSKMTISNTVLKILEYI